MKLITVKELSEEIKIKKSTIYAWAEQGKIPCYKLGGLLRFNPVEIEEWVRKSKVLPVKIGNLRPSLSSFYDVDKTIKRAIDEVTNIKV